MDSTKNVPSTPEVGNPDTDVSLFLIKVGKWIKNLLDGIWYGLLSLAKAAMSLFAFIFRNIVYVLIGVVIAIAYGVYNQSKRGPDYISQMTIKTNFGSAQSLYNTINYLNALISTNNTSDLSKLFNISKEDAKKLTSFAVEPVESETIISMMYKEQLLDFNRSSVIRMDTFWTRTIPYKDFKKNLTSLDYPYHTITVKSTNGTIFPQLTHGLLAYISNNDFLQGVKAKYVINSKSEESLIVSAIESLDTLRKAYSERIAKGQPSSVPGSNQLTVVQSGVKETKAPELELYDKLLDLQDELTEVRKRSVTEQNILEIYSPFSPTGKKISFGESIIRYIVFGAVTPIVILTLLLLYRSSRTYLSQEKIKPKQKLTRNN